VRALRVVKSADPSSVDENRILEQVLAGDADAFAYFVRAYQKRVYGMALRFLRDAGEAECVAQESFLKAYQALADFRGGSSFETWITRIAINACRDRLKRKRLVVYFHQAAPPDPDHEVPEDRIPSPRPSPERLLHAKQIQARLHEAIGKLSPRQRVVFVLKHMEERSIPEIANLLGLDSGTIKSHLFRAANKVRERLRDMRSLS
jgi:RNA polymerase sigma-70 factor (ECF subfamily)